MYWLEKIPKADRVQTGMRRNRYPPTQAGGVRTSKLTGQRTAEGRKPNLSDKVRTVTPSGTSPPSLAQQELCPGLGFLTSLWSWKGEPDPPGWSTITVWPLAPRFLSQPLVREVYPGAVTVGANSVYQGNTKQPKSNQSASFPYPQATQESRHLREVLHPQPLIRVEKGQGWGQPHWLRGQAQVSTGPVPS